jgi:DeoR/GlpR family transcriptional regulator of sugar metabolism
MLQEKGEITILELTHQFGVSEMTVRRDLDRLEESGRVRRTHGGAMLAERMVFEFDFASRRQAHRRAKLAIAREAVKLVKPGHRIVLDAGTTTLELALLLRDFQDITVLTPSLAVASELQFSEGIRLVLLGGIVRKGSPDLTGPVTEAVLEMFAADIAFQGADGIGVDGALYTDDMRMGQVDQKIRQRAQSCYVLADSSKIGKTALARFGLVQQVDALITDDEIDPLAAEQYQKLGCNVVVVTTEP